MNAFEGPPGAHRHVDVAVLVGVEALDGSRALGADGTAGVENPFLSCTWG